MKLFASLLADQTVRGLFSARLAVCLVTAFFSMLAKVGAQTEFLEGARITGIELTYTSGTVVLQKLTAEKSVVAEDARSILNKDVSIEINSLETGEPVYVKSPFARYYYAGKTNARQAPYPFDRRPPRGLMAALSTARIEKYDSSGAPATGNPSKGDILLSSEDGGMDVEADLGERGVLRAATLVWSEEWKRFLAPGPFVQESRMEGGVLRVTGNGFAADRNFTDWWYLVESDTPMEFVFEGARGQ